MTDWSRLDHAYGSAEDVPALLDALERDPTEENWGEIWGCLCHQGTVYSASFAALARLTQIAAGLDGEQLLNALTLAGSIVAGGVLSGEFGDVRQKYASEIAALTQLATGLRPAPRDSGDYGYLLGALEAFHGDAAWAERLGEIITNEECEVMCPTCEEDILLDLGEGARHATTYDLVGPDAVTTPLRPCGAAALTGAGHRLHELALADAQPRVAEIVTYLFGRATCPICGADLGVPDGIFPAGPEA